MQIANTSTILRDIDKKLDKVKYVSFGIVKIKGDKKFMSKMTEKFKLIAVGHFNVKLLPILTKLW